MEPQELREQLRYAYDPHFRGFHQLMAKRVKTILMVSNHYESFSMARDASLTHDIYGTSQLLHLQNVPQITTALSGHDALGTLEGERFDLVLASANLPDTDTFEFSRQVKAKYPDLPVVLLVFDGRWFDRMYAGAEPEGLDGIFAWRGSAVVLLSIMKLVEDRLNVDHDLRRASIGTIIVVEDSVEHYSSLLPQLYATLMQRTFSLVPEGINESERQIRTRVRPKVLLARTFREAEALFSRYEQSLLGIISDLRTVAEERTDPDSGVRFLRTVSTKSPGTPILIQSADPRGAEVAASLAARYVDKRSPRFSAALEQFVEDDIGFGNFVFRSREGQQLARAANLWEMETVLPSVPEDSIVYHAERNDFSHWFRARGETTLAAVVRPVTPGDFPTAAGLKDFLWSAVSIARMEKYRGAIADFRGAEFDPGYPFLVSGRGSLGGKGRGLAFMFHLLSRHLKEERIEGIRIRLPHTLVVAADQHDKFMRENNFDLTEVSNLDDAPIRQLFVSGSLSEGLQQDVREYVERVNFPLAVRSSSLLEDSHFQPFAGLYATYMLPNNHPDPSVRLDHLCQAIKLVYASAYFQRPRRYFESIGMNPAEEKMAVVIQEVAGRAHGDLYYPTFSGVAQSHNYYSIPPMSPEDGVVTVALGLGKQVVEGGEAVRFCPRHPQVLPQFGSPTQIMKVSQRDFFALDLSRNDADLTEGTHATLLRLPLSRAEENGALKVIGSVVSVEEDRIYDGVNRPGSRVVTFGRILKSNVFPLCGILNRLLDIGRESMGCALEIEFAVNLDQGQGNEPEFYFLQMRPLVALRERCDLALEGGDSRKVLCRSHRVMGNGRIEDLADLLYVHPDRFDRAHSADVASALADTNRRLSKERRRYILLGPGRWGSLDPWLGIPVVWHQISEARVIVEVATRDVPVDPSQGTHFFHNMTSAGIGYFSLPAGNDPDFVRWELLESLPGEQISPWLRYVRLKSPVIVQMDGQTQQGVICLP